MIPLVLSLGKHTLSNPDDSLADETKSVHFKYTIKIYLVHLDDQVDLITNLCGCYLQVCLQTQRAQWKGLREKPDKVYWGRIGILNGNEAVGRISPE